MSRQPSHPLLRELLMLALKNEMTTGANLRLQQQTFALEERLMAQDRRIAELERDSKKEKR